MLNANAKKQTGEAGFKYQIGPKHFRGPTTQTNTHKHTHRPQCNQLLRETTGLSVSGI